MTARRRRLLTTFFGGLLLVILAVDGFLLLRKRRYETEEARLRQGMTDVERLTADAIVAKERERTEVMFELIRRQALGDPQLHLSVMVDSSVMILERSNAVLRRMPVALGAETPVDTLPGARRLAIPTGVRSLERLIDAGDQYELPEWVWQQRNLPVPEDRSDSKFIGAGGFVLNGGTLVYALPAEGPLADSSWVMPGTIRISKEDLDAIRPNLVRGMKVYLF
jgi:hypothetical protein